MSDAAQIGPQYGGNALVDSMADILEFVQQTGNLIGLW
jgi:hypothetical protein